MMNVEEAYRAGLTLERIPGGFRVARVRVTPGRQVSKAYVSWRLFVAKLTVHLATGSATWMASMAPESWSELEGLPWTRKISGLTSYPIFSIRAKESPPGFIHEVAESEDFHRGYCWMLIRIPDRLDGEEEKRVLRGLLNAHPRAPEPGLFPDLNVLLLDPDGEVLTGLGPALEAVSDAKLRSLAQSSGCHVVLDEADG